MSVTLRQLEAFRHVWEKGSLSEAADAMGLTHSAVQRLISQLETSIDGRLFDRDGGKAHPTHAAEALSANVDRIMRNLDKVTALADEETRINRASLRIGTLTSFGPAILPAVLKTLRRRYQSLRISIDIERQSTIEAGFVRGDYDLCLVMLPLLSDVPSAERIGSLPTVCVLPHGHRLATKDVVTPTDLSGERFISVYRGSPMRKETDDLFENAGVNPIVEIEARSSGMVCSMVARGLGVSIMASHYTAPWSEQILVKPFEPESRIEYAVLRSDAARERASVQAFVDASKATLRDFNGQTQLDG